MRALAFPRGPGPAYVGLGTAGIVYYAEDTREHGGWYYHKVLIGISPDYRLGLSINGRCTDGREILGWHNGPFPGEKDLVLDVPAEEGGPGWRYVAGDVLIRAPGCYVIRLEGGDFFEEVAFRAEPLPRSEVRCPSPDGAYEPKVTPAVGPAGSEATVSGPLPLYSKSGRYAGPTGKKVELWWNLEPSRYATTVSFGASSPQSEAAKDGPVLLVGATRLCSRGHRARQRSPPRGRGTGARRNRGIGGPQGAGATVALRTGAEVGHRTRSVVRTKSVLSSDPIVGDACRNALDQLIHRWGWQDDV